MLYLLGTPDTSLRGRSTRKALSAFTSNPAPFPPRALAPSALVACSKIALKSLEERKESRTVRTGFTGLLGLHFLNKPGVHTGGSTDGWKLASSQLRVSPTPRVVTTAERGLSKGRDRTFALRTHLALCQLGGPGQMCNAGEVATSSGMPPFHDILVPPPTRANNRIPSLPTP